NATTTGLVELSIACVTSGRCGACGGLANSVTSAPATNVLPSQRSTIARIAGSLSTERSAASKPLRTGCDNALTVGLSIVMGEISPSALNLTGGVASFFTSVPL